MAVPKKKVSISRKRIRNITAINKIKGSFCNYSICPNCTSLKKKHNICNSCGFYKNNYTYGDKR